MSYAEKAKSGLKVINKKKGVEELERFEATFVGEEETKKTRKRRRQQSEKEGGRGRGRGDCINGDDAERCSRERGGERRGRDDVSSFGRRNRRRRRRRRRNRRKQQQQLSDDGEDAWRYALRVRFVWVRVLHAVTGWDGDIYAGVCASAGAGADDDGGAFVVGIRTSLAARWDCFAATDDDE